MSIEVERLTGPEIGRFLPELARLRITVFREYPYLYDGDSEYELKYLQTYANAPESVFVIVRDGERVVGASTGTPLACETEEVKAPFLQAGYDVGTIFYFGESVLEPAYRGRGLGSRFFDEREAHALSLGRIRTTCFCAVERSADDPRRPAAYRPLDEFWSRRGYRRHPELRTTFTWRELGNAEETAQPMVFFLKHWPAEEA